MRATAVVPVKRFDAAKERLAEALPAQARADLAAAMLDDVLTALRRCERLDRVIVVSGEPSAAEAAAAAGADWLDDPDDAGHSHAAAVGVRSALGAGAAAAALLPGDCPMLDPTELDRALADLRRGSVGVVPDRHATGTNGLLLCPPDAIGPSFGPDSRERHLDLARHAGVEASIVAISSLALDLDTPADLDVLRSRVAVDPDRAPSTARALLRIDRSEGTWPGP